MKVLRLSAWVLGCCIVVLLAAAMAARASEGGGDFSREELAQMLAPVALYPDALLSQVLMGATYPLELVEADRWVKKHSLLRGDNLDEALRDQDWDASVKALCHVPAVLAVMSERLEETTRLGDAFLAQEQEVMDTIQDLRVRAMREGNLKSDDKQKVVVQEDGTIVIEPADQQTVYVPYYNTRYVYGPWWYPAWPPWYWGPGEVVVGSNIYFWPDYYFGFGFGFGYWSRFDWPGRTIVIDVRRRPHFFRPDHGWTSPAGRWHHEPHHRKGVVYRDRPTAERFNQPPERVKRAERQATRDRVERGPKAREVERDGGEVRRGKSGGVEKSPGRGRVERPQDLKSNDRPAVPPRDRGGAKDEVRRQDRERVERRGNEAAAPPLRAPARVEPPVSGPDRRGGGGEARREPPRERERTSGNVGVGSPREENRPDRRGDWGREERRPGELGRGGGGGNEDGRGDRGGRR